ncbi:MAG: hypothetical protein QNL04_00030 [SAR324 cluster bacterium]|nr:hypothetical protein [SAR324 cluster bacterium]
MAEEKKEKVEKKDGLQTLMDIEARINKRFEHISDLPLADASGFWTIQGLEKVQSKEGKLFGIFSKKKLSDEQLTDLRRSALLSPGKTQTELVKLKKMYPNHPELLMLSAICTHGNVMNSGGSKQLQGLKSAVKEAATALMSNGISIYNAENFFKIYYIFIERIRREQKKVFDEVSMDPRLDTFKRKIALEMTLVDYLASEKKKTLNIIAHLKKKLKSSAYSQYFSHFQLTKACQLVGEGQPKEKLDFCTASEFIAFTYALFIAFSKIPILYPLVDQYLKLIPAGNLGLHLRKVSVNSSRHFSMFRQYTILGEHQKLKKISQTIFGESLACIKKTENATLYQVYETDPFFNLAYITELTVGLFGKGDTAKMVRTATVAMETVIKKDMSKGHLFTETAKNHTHKLANLGGDGETA